MGEGQAEARCERSRREGVGCCPGRARGGGADYAETKTMMLQRGLQREKLYVIDASRAGEQRRMPMGGGRTGPAVNRGISGRCSRC